MKKVIAGILFSGLFYGVGNLYSQARIDSIPPSGKDIVRQGIELYDNGKYDEAIHKCNQVRSGDPGYEWACYETALALESQKNYSLALTKCEESIQLKPTDIQRLVLKGSILDDLGRTAEAINWLEPLVEKYSYNQNLLFNLAICYIAIGDLVRAEALLIRGLHYNPYHTNSHLALAKINLIMGRMAQSYLAYDMAIIMSPRIDYIRRLEAAISGENSSISRSYLYNYPVNYVHSQWDYLTGLLNAEVAFREDFKYEYKLNSLSFRQSYLLFQKMKFDRQDTTFYSQFYVRFFKNMFDANRFETFINYSLKRTDNKIAKDWIEKNQPAIDDFVKQSKTAIDLWQEYGFLTSNEDRHVKMFHFSKQGDLESYGSLTDAPTSSKEGKWQFIAANGTISQSGEFKNNLREGEFRKFWPTCNLKQQLNFKNDNLTGVNFTFHPNGSKAGIFPRQNGLSNGIEQEYTPAGRLISQFPYKEGKIHGTTVYNDYNKGFIRRMSFVNDKREGEVDEKWFNGNTKLVTTYSDSLLNGSYKKWYSNGIPEWEGGFVKDLQVGPWRSFYSNGVKSAEGTYDQTGNPAESYTAFYRSASKSEQIKGYKNGKPNGIQTLYFPDGKIKSVSTIEQDQFKQLECYNLSGEKVYTAREEDGIFNFKSFFPDGTVKLEGKYIKGAKNGPWKGYNIFGSLLTEENWVNGYRSGVQKVFYSNGNPKLIYSCDSSKTVGKVIEYFENGHVSHSGYSNKDGNCGESVSYYSNDSIESVSYFIENKIAGTKSYYSPTGKLTCEEIFDIDNEPIGIKYFDVAGRLTDSLNFPYDSLSFMRHFPNGAIKEKLTIVDHKVNGLREYFFPNGRIGSRQMVIFGNSQGLYQEWDHNGVPISVRNYSMNELDGQIAHYENGTLFSTDSYELGVNQGLYKEYHPNGHIFRTIMDESGERQGNSDCYAPDSSLMYSFQYIDDETYSVSYRDNLGKLHAKEPIGKEKREIICYYENGKVSARLSFLKGCFHGKYVIYYPSGLPLREVNYENDIREGILKNYYENGQLKELTNWRNGSRDGVYTRYFPNGKRSMEGKYLANKKEGKWMVYNEAGKLVETLYYFDNEIYQID